MKRIGKWLLDIIGIFGIVAAVLLIAAWIIYVLTIAAIGIFGGAV